MALSVREYVRIDGANPFRSWFENLHAEAAAKAAAAIARLAAGDAGNVKRIGAIGEYRIDWGPGYRIYFGKDGDALIILLGGGTRKRQQSDIANAGRCGRSTECERGRIETMPLTRDFRATVVARVRRDPAFARALLDEAATLFLNGEPVAARLVLRDLVNATMGFEALAKKTSRPSKSLQRMLSKNGNPSMDNIAAIIGALRDALGVDLTARAVLAKLPKLEWDKSYDYKKERSRAFG